MIETVHHGKREQLLEEINRQLIATWNEHDPTQTLKSTLSNILNLVDTEVLPSVHISASVCLYVGNRFQIEEAIGPIESVLRANAPRAEGTSAYVAQQRASIFVNDVSQWPSGIPQIQMPYLKAGIQSYACVPLIVGEREHAFVTGVLVLCTTESHKFNQEDQSLIEIFAAEAALVLHNARLFQRNLQESAALREISAAAIDEEMDEVALAKLITRHAVQLSRSDYASLWTVNSSETSLHLSSQFGNDPNLKSPHMQLSAGSDTLVGMIALERHTQYVDGLKNPRNPHHTAWHPEFTAAFCTPLIAHRNLLGVLYVATEQPGGMVPRYRRFLSNLAVHAANTLYSCVLRREERRAEEVRTAVIQFQQRISDVLPLPQQIVQIQRELRPYLDVDGLFVARYAESSQKIWFAKAYEDGQRIDLQTDERPERYAPRTLGKRQGFVEWIIRNQESLLIEDFATAVESNTITPDERQGVQSCLVVPMRLKGNIVGAIGVRSYKEIRAFDRYDQLFLESAANHCAIVIDNSEWYEREEDRIVILNAITQFQQNVTDILSIDSQVEQIREELTHFFDTSNIFIATCDVRKDLIRVPVIYEDGNPIPFEQKRVGDLYGPRHLGEHNGLHDWVIQHRRPLLIGDFEQSPLRNQIDPIYRQNLKCCLVVPLLRGNRVTGVIGLRGYERPGMFSEFHQRLLETLASHIAIVIHNSNIMNELQISESKNLAADRITSLNIVTAEFAHKLTNALGTIPPKVDLIQELLPKDVNPKAIEYLTDISSIAKDVLDTANNIKLQSSHMHHESLDAVEIDYLITHVIRHIALPKSILLDYERYSGSLKIWVFPKQFMDIVENIIKNGIEAIEDAGTIAVRCHRLDPDWCTINISDTGAGIALENQPRVFELFQSSKSDGMGFALWRAQTNIKQFGGELKFESTPGVGTTFRIKLPLVD